jgi:hypothetical protein
MNAALLHQFGIAIALLSGPVSAVYAQDGALAGEYFCVSGGTCPCDGDNKLKLSVNGNWRLGAHTGSYRASGQSVSFEGAGGAAAWGPATVSRGTLTFNTGNAPVVCFQPGKTEPPAQTTPNDKGG